MRGRWPLGIPSVSYLDATRDMPMVYLLWYAHFAFAVAACAPELEAVEIQVDDWRCVQRQHLAENQPTDDGDAQGTAQLRTNARAKRQWQATQQGRHGGHDDGAETQQTGLEDGRLRALAFAAFGFKSEVDHHDGVLFHDADEQDDADDGDNAQIEAVEQERQQRANAGRRQRGENGDRMNIAFIQDTKHNIDRYQGRRDQKGLIRQRVLKRLSRPLKAAADGGGQADLARR